MLRTTPVLQQHQVQQPVIHLERGAVQPAQVEAQLRAASDSVVPLVSCGGNTRQQIFKSRRVGHHGNATLTRLPVEHAENFDVSTNRVERRGVLYTRLRLGERPLHVLNVHLSLSHRQRVRQLRRIADIVATRAADGEPILMAKLIDANKFYGALFEHVKVIWYEAADGLDPVTSAAISRIANPCTRANSSTDRWSSLSDSMAWFSRSSRSPRRANREGGTM